MPLRNSRPREGGKGLYDYLPLREAVLRKGDEVNFYGVICEYEHPKPTRGSDVLCTMTVIDMSYDNPGLRLLLFTSAMNCPLVKSLGDIIRVHRVEMGDYKDSPQAIAKVNRKSSFILLDGKNGRSHEPYQKSHSMHTFEEHDELLVDNLRRWIESHPLGTRISDYLVPISGIKDNSYFDLCCKILYVDDRHQPYRTTIIYVWDGTDATPRTIPVLSEKHPEEFSLQAYEKNALPFILPPRDVLCDFPRVGTMLPIILQLPLDDLPGQLPQRGDWVKFRNLGCRNHSGFVEAVFTRESKISLLSTDTQLVKNCENLYEERILTEGGRLPQSTPKPPMSLTVTDFEHVAFSTLREVLTSPQVTSRFRCLVRVISTWPSQVVNFCEPMDETAESLGQYVYGVKFRIEDPTAMLNAYLYAEDGAKFFNGHPPANLHKENAIVGALERKVQKLLGYRIHPDGTPDPDRDPPWIKCCLKSYYTDKEHSWEGRCYRIFGTTFPG